MLNGASVNFSCVHYDDRPQKPLRSATALSTIIHPDHPRAPSMHMHISWTERRNGPSYWRLMADLNPSVDAPEATQRFEQRLARVTGPLHEEGKEQGDRYFYIPALKRHRGSFHFYLEGHRTDDHDRDRAFAQRFGETVIDGYSEILDEILDGAGPPTEDERAEQLAYHTVYLFQVLTLDRGTTAGLLVHDQNDLGILASLPSFVDRDRLARWIDRVEPPQDQLLGAIVDALPDESPAEVTEEVRRTLADLIREHYRRHPEATKLQASAKNQPPTVANHGG